MASTCHCPKCGAHLRIVLATDTVLGHASHPPPSCGLGSLDLDSPEDQDHIKRLKEIMCAPRQGDWIRPKQPTLRPVVTDHANVVGAVKDNRSRETLDRAARKMHAAIRRSGERSASTLLHGRCCGSGRNHNDGPGPSEPELVFEVIGAIIYDMEWTSGGVGDSGPEKHGLKTLAGAAETTRPKLDNCSYQCERAFEVMLLIDYGFPASPVRASGIGGKRFFLDVMWPKFEILCGYLTATAWRWRQGQAVPDGEAWDQISRVVAFWKCIWYRVPLWDVATMLYYYQSHRKPVNAHDREERWTGYTGVLQEMVAEIPTRGTDRLERKLSLDVHFLIPRFVKDYERRTQMISRAQDLATQHGCHLEPPKPPLWKRCFNSLAGFVQSRQRLDGEDSKKREEEKLIEELEDD